MLIGGRLLDRVADPPKQTGAGVATTGVAGGVITFMTTTFEVIGGQVPPGGPEKMARHQVVAKRSVVF